MTKIQLPELFTTNNINLATALISQGFIPQRIKPGPDNRVVFEFTRSPGLIDAILLYEANEGGVKSLLETRGRLFREASAITRTGKAWVQS